MKNVAVATAVFTSVLFTGAAQADVTYTCTHDADQRIISVVYQDPSSKLPCQVDYTKNGATQTLWSADNTTGYCEEKAEALVEKQAMWGWSCTSDAVLNGDTTDMNEIDVPTAPASTDSMMETEAENAPMAEENATSEPEATVEASGSTTETVSEPAKQASDTPYLQ